MNPKFVKGNMQVAGRGIDICMMQTPLIRQASYVYIGATVHSIHDVTEEPDCWRPIMIVYLDLQWPLINSDQKNIYGGPSNPTTRQAARRTCCTGCNNDEPLDGNIADEHC
jgi:hypothetical protein